MTDGMDLIDTNVLLRSVHVNHPMYGVSVQALASLMNTRQPLCVALQNIAEFWNVATRPLESNGLGLSLREVARHIQKFEQVFEVLPESESSYRIWKNLVESRRVSGVQVHDARLVSVMLASGIGRIVTFNTADFTRYPEIQAVHPAHL